MRLDEKYRPRTFDDVCGQDKAVSVLQRVDCSGRGIYITGKSGTGKTTLALLIAQKVACPEGITELTGRELTVNRLRDWYLTAKQAPGIFGGYALIVNESHGMSKPVIEVLLNVLEALPDWAVIIFTTTKEGAELFEDTQIDSGPFASRCLRIELAQRGITSALAERLQNIARKENLDGKPIESYVQLLRDKRNNMRACLNFIESGGMMS